MRTLLDFYKYKPEWMNEFYSQLHAAWKENRLLLIFLVTYILTVLIVMIIATHKSYSASDMNILQNKRSDAILRELNDINSLLHDVEHNPLNNQQQQMALQVIEKDILSAQKSMLDVAKVTDIHKVTSQISSVKDDIDSQMINLKKSISENVSSKQILDANALPFHVISVDVIAGQPYVTVEYAGHVSPLAVSDLLAGWRVTSADYQSGISEFVNEKNQYVKISLQGG